MIGLHAVPVDREDIRPLLVDEGVEVEGDYVVLGRLVPIGTIRANEGGVGIVGVHPEVEMSVVVRDVDLGCLTGGRAIERPQLNEIRDAGRILPDDIIQSAVDVRWVRRAGGGDGRPARQDAGGRRGTDACARPHTSQPWLAGLIPGPADCQAASHLGRRDPLDKVTLCHRRCYEVFAANTLSRRPSRGSARGRDLG